MNIWCCKANLKLWPCPILRCPGLVSSYNNMEMHCRIALDIKIDIVYRNIAFESPNAARVAVYHCSTAKDADCGEF